jgi:peptidoglycan hydrolase-like protein with peptidoglycan-binding domain
MLAQEVRAFQSFVGLPVTGEGDFSTWASLLVSHGDQDRRGAACDGVTKITPARAETLRSQGITYVGRYLTNPSRTSLPEKAIQPGELSTIKDQGLRCFPIYQTFGRDATDFSYALGRAAGYAATNAAEDHGFRHGTLIYFAVDFDILDHEVTSSILPHFKGVEDSMARVGDPYRIGIYGPRNVCTRVAQAGHSVSSFVSDMSYGFSGNYGYPLPADWAFDQFVTRTIGSGDGRIEIDNVVASGRDTGQNSFDPPRGVVPDARLDPSITATMSDDVGKCMESMGRPSLDEVRQWDHDHCFRTVVVEHDALVTDLSQQYSMRKALIQTSAYWEMRHVDAKDKLGDLLVEQYHNGIPGGARDCSTGIAQINGEVAILAWDHCISNGHASGEIRDPDNDSDVYAMWKKVQGEEFALRTVAMIHMWGAAGKPGGNNPPDGESVLRPIALDYTENEVLEILRRYQGWGPEAKMDVRYRMALYHVFEKYNGISRNK